MVTKVLSEEDLPAWFQETGITEQAPVVRAISECSQQGNLSPVSDSVRMRWDHLRAKVARGIFTEGKNASGGFSRRSFSAGGSRNSLLAGVEQWDESGAYGRD